MTFYYKLKMNKSHFNKFFSRVNRLLLNSLTNRRAIESWTDKFSNPFSKRKHYWFKLSIFKLISKRPNKNSACSKNKRLKERKIFSKYNRFLSARTSSWSPLKRNWANFNRALISSNPAARHKIYKAAKKRSNYCLRSFNWHQTSRRFFMRYNLFRPNVLLWRIL